VLKEKELVKTKGVKEWQQEECIWDSFIETIKHYNIVGLKTNLLPSGSLQSNWVGLLDNLATTQPMKQISNLSF
jgi:hypothetical protein